MKPLLRLPSIYLVIMLPYLPCHLALIYISGFFEVPGVPACSFLGCGYGLSWEEHRALQWRRTR